MTLRLQLTLFLTWLGKLVASNSSGVTSSRQMSANVWCIDSATRPLTQEVAILILGEVDEDHLATILELRL